MGSVSPLVPGYVCVRQNFRDTTDASPSPRPPEPAPEEVVTFHDKDSGANGVIVLHSTALGPAAGGCRLWHYADDRAATVDALRLAEGMALKNALANLPFGGGKAVIRLPQGPFDRAALFRAFGRQVAELKGRYVTAEDVGTSVADMAEVATRTRHVAGLPVSGQKPGGDPSPWTALGVVQAMRVAVRQRLGAELSDVTVGVQGWAMSVMRCASCSTNRARLIVAEPHSEVAARAADRFGAMVMSSRALLSARVDVLALRIGRGAGRRDGRPTARPRGVRRGQQPAGQRGHGRATGRTRHPLCPRLPGQCGRDHQCRGRISGLARRGGPAAGPGGRADDDRCPDAGRQERHHPDEAARAMALERIAQVPRVQAVAA